MKLAKTDELKYLRQWELASISDCLDRGINLITCQASLDMFDELMINYWQILIDNEYGLVEELQARYDDKREGVLKDEA